MKITPAKIPAKAEKLSSELSLLQNSHPLEVSAAATEIIKAACKRIGMSIDDYLLVIKEALKASTVRTEIRDGELINIDEPNHVIRLKAAAMGLEVEGYLKAKVAGDIVQNNNTSIIVVEKTVEERLGCLHSLN